MREMGSPSADWFKFYQKHTLTVIPNLKRSVLYINKVTYIQNVAESEN